MLTSSTALRSAEISTMTNLLRCSSSRATRAPTIAGDAGDDPPTITFGDATCEGDEFELAGLTRRTEDVGVLLASRPRIFGAGDGLSAPAASAAAISSASRRRMTYGLMRRPCAELGRGGRSRPVPGVDTKLALGLGLSLALAARSLASRLRLDAVVLGCLSSVPRLVGGPSLGRVIGLLPSLPACVTTAASMARRTDASFSPRLRLTCCSPAFERSSLRKLFERPTAASLPSPSAPERAALAYVFANAAPGAGLADCAGTGRPTAAGVPADVTLLPLAYASYLGALAVDVGVILRVFCVDVGVASLAARTAASCSPREARSSSLHVSSPGRGFHAFSSFFFGVAFHAGFAMTDGEDADGVSGARLGAVLTFVFLLDARPKSTEAVGDGAPLKSRIHAACMRPDRPA